MLTEPHAEQRRFKRISTNEVAVTYKLYNTHTLPMYQDEIEENAHNISLGGISFKTHTPLPHDAPIGLNIRLGKTRPIRTFGRIVWADNPTPAADGKVGVRFSWWLSDEDKKILNSYIDKQAPRGIAA